MVGSREPHVVVDSKDQAQLQLHCIMVELVTAGKVALLVQETAHLLDRGAYDLL